MTGTWPRRGGLYALHVPNGHAKWALILSEDAWNCKVADSVAVPVFEEPGAEPSLLKVDLGEDRFANCTLVQSIKHEFIGEQQASDSCSQDAWVRVLAGVRMFLAIDQLEGERRSPAPLHPKAGWWPKQAQVCYDKTGLLGQPKMWAIINDNDWNSTRNYSSTVRLTSNTKPWRGRWEVLVPGGTAVSLDLLVMPHHELNPIPPAPPRPRALTDIEMADLAKKLRVSLGLSKTDRN